MTTILKPNPNNRFIEACLGFDDLMGMLAALRANHFNVEPEVERDWGDVSSLEHVNELLMQAVEHYTGSDDRVSA